MRLTPLGCTAVWYSQPGDWEQLKEDLPELQQSDQFIDKLLVSLHQKCIDGENLLLDSLTGSGNLLLAQAAFNTYGKRTQPNTTKPETAWALMFLQFQLLDCILWYRNCSLEGKVRLTAKQLPLGPRPEIEKDCDKFFQARFNWHGYLPDFVKTMQDEMLGNKRKGISENWNEDVVSLLAFMIIHSKQIF